MQAKTTSLTLNYVHTSYRRRMVMQRLDIVYCFLCFCRSRHQRNRRTSATDISPRRVVRTGRNLAHW